MCAPRGSILVIRNTNICFCNSFMFKAHESGTPLRKFFQKIFGFSRGAPQDQLMVNSNKHKFSNGCIRMLNIGGKVLICNRGDFIFGRCVYKSKITVLQGREQLSKKAPSSCSSVTFSVCQQTWIKHWVSSLQL